MRVTVNPDRATSKTIQSRCVGCMNRTCDIRYERPSTGAIDEYYCYKPWCWKACTSTADPPTPMQRGCQSCNTRDNHHGEG